MAIRLWNIANPVDSSIIEETALVHINATLALPSITGPDFLFALDSARTHRRGAQCAITDEK